MFLCAWVRFHVGKGCEQCLQIFQNGYARFALACRVFCQLEYFSSAAFNDTAMVSGDDLVRTIRLNTERGIFVVVIYRSFYRPPTERLIVHIIT